MNNNKKKTLKEPTNARGIASISPLFFIHFYHVLLCVNMIGKSGTDYIYIYVAYISKCGVAHFKSEK